ncbi:hypothetical protein C3F09_01865 [candidate division GN15 bacterium]|uniref:Permease n=1 Tax=candidate division GN15 bacterium TaxID=2072418 RepID=A0A855XCV9_9BACT|nr:MAG: hypothetical protein C3F09_01865 [candidate division GN15 bacterium]
MDFLANWAGSTWGILLDSAFLFLVGLTLAGLVSIILNAETVRRIGRGSAVSTVVKASLIGLPLPLCSCSVLPVAAQLRKSGVSKGGVMAFLVSTPESGVDSILLTYALTDPVLTVARPVSAYLTAMTAGLVESIGFSKQPVLPTVEATACCDDECCCAKSPKPAKRSFVTRVLIGIKYAFTDMLADLAPYLLIGFLLAGLVAALVGLEGTRIPGAVSGWAGYAWGIGIGVPLYVCATSSTPLAAVLLGAGFSPGAILVFLLVGPATNVAGIVVMRRILGGWSTVRFLISVVVTAVLCGLALDGVYRWTGVTPSYHAGESHGEGATAVAVVSAVGLSALILYYCARKLLRRIG